MFRSSLPHEHHHPDALAFYCSDGRFTRAVEELAAHLGEERVDVMCLPGGPGLLDEWTSTSVIETHLVADAAGFLISGHHTRTVLLVAHEGCGFYARRYGDLDADGRRARQEGDLIRAVERVRGRHPGVEVRAFYAVVRGTPPAVEFDPVPG
jgi:hypothetical protein